MRSIRRLHCGGIDPRAVQVSRRKCRRISVRRLPSEKVTGSARRRQNRTPPERRSPAATKLSPHCELLIFWNALGNGHGVPAWHDVNKQGNSPPMFLLSTFTRMNFERTHSCPRMKKRVCFVLSRGRGVSLLSLPPSHPSSPLPPSPPWGNPFAFIDKWIAR